MAKQNISLLTEAFTDWCVLKRAIQVAILVGLILNLINQGENLISGQLNCINWWKFGFTFIVPFLVSAYSSALARIQFTVGEIAPSKALLICSECDHEILIERGEYIPLCDKHSNVGFWKISNRSADEIKRIEEKLQSLALFPELNPAPVFRIDKTGIITESNAKAKEFFNKTDLKNIPVSKVLPHTQKLDIHALINNGKQEVVEVSNHDQTIQFHLRGIPELNTCQVYGADITAERAIRNELESMAMFAKLNPEPVIRVQNNGTVINANPAALEAFPEIEIGCLLANIITDLKDFDLVSHISYNQIHKLETTVGNRIYRFMLRGISHLQICQLYGADITERRLAEQKVSQQNIEIEKSIRYASLIQNAALNSSEILNNIVTDSFIIYEPKDIISGDFYWAKKQENRLYFCAADCTGHGVPGALLSMLGISLLNQIIATNTIKNCNEILDELREKIKSTIPLSQDGMDIALCCIDTDNLMMQFSGANNPLYIINEHSFTVLKGDKMPIGKHAIEDSFTTSIHQLNKGDRLFLFSDGFVDQFGGPKNKKFKQSQLKSLLADSTKESLQSQRNLLENTFIKWKGGQEQIDDVLLMGIEI